MRWENERYVRLYTRDTPEELALGWEACALWRELLRKFDRAGIIDLGKTGIRGLAALTRIPLEVVERNLPLLLDDGRVRLAGTKLLCPNYIAANETPSSGSQRTREWRARQREIGDSGVSGLTTCDESSQVGDDPSPNDDRVRRGVTDCDAGVTRRDSDAGARAPDPDLDFCSGSPGSDPDPPVVPRAALDPLAPERQQGLPLDLDGEGASKPAVAGKRRKGEDIPLVDLCDEATWVLREIIEHEDLRKTVALPNALAKELDASARQHGLDPVAIVADARSYMPRAKKQIRNGATFLRNQLAMRIERAANGEVAFLLREQDLVAHGDGMEDEAQRRLLPGRLPAPSPWMNQDVAT